jgi:iron complex outermembrane receptor protein
VETHSYAAYFNGDYRFSEAIELTAGFRFTREDKSLNFSMLDPYQIFFGHISGLTDSRTDYDFSPRIGLNVHLDTATMLYATYSRGFKSGGWNADLVTNAQIAAGLRVNPEKAKNYEIGVKSTFFGGKARVNLSGFWETFDNFQVSQLTLRTIAGAPAQQVALTNAGKVSTKGVELALTAIPLGGVTMSANVSYDDSRYDSFAGGGGAYLGQIVDANGAETPFAPRLKAYVAVDYDRPLFPWADLTGHVGYAARSGENSDAKIVNPSLGYIFAIPGASSIDARVGLASPDKVWTFTLWVKNLADKAQIIQSTNSALFNRRMVLYDAPRTFGMTLTREF